MRRTHGRVLVVIVAVLVAVAALIGGLRAFGAARTAGPVAAGPEAG